jgi:hypothetical protein
MLSDAETVGLRIRLARAYNSCSRFWPKASHVGIGEGVVSRDLAGTAVQQMVQRRINEVRASTRSRRESPAYKAG